MEKKQYLQKRSNKQLETSLETKLRREAIDSWKHLWRRVGRLRISKSKSTGLWCNSASTNIEGESQDFGANLQAQTFEEEPQDFGATLQAQNS